MNRPAEEVSAAAVILVVEAEVAAVVESAPEVEVRASEAEKKVPVATASNGDAGEGYILQRRSPSVAAVEVALIAEAMEVALAEVVLE